MASNKIIYQKSMFYKKEQPKEEIILDDELQQDNQLLEETMRKEQIFYEFVGNEIQNENGEIITKAFYDIDLNTKKCSECFGLEDKESFEETHQLFKKMLLCNSKKNDYIITDGSYFENNEDMKISFHIIFFKILIDKKKFLNSNNFTEIGKLMYADYGICTEQELISYFDPDVYKGKHLFRLPFATCSKKKHPHIPLNPDIPLCEYFISFFGKNSKKTELSFPNVEPLREPREPCRGSTTPQSGGRGDMEGVAIKYCNLLNPTKRAYEYGPWRKLLMTLKNIGVPFEYFDKISKESGYLHYSRNNCLEHWEKYEKDDEKNNYGLTTLKKWAEEDNPEEFKKIEFGDIANNLLQNCSHQMCAEAFALYKKDTIYYTSGYGWIFFDEISRTWTLNNKKEDLVYPICKFFSKKVENRITFLSLKEEKTESEVKKLVELSKLRLKVGCSSFAKGVADQLQYLMKQPDTIMDKFDANPYLFAFSDGKCIDLANGCRVREIQKEDFIYTTCGYPYPKKNEKNMALAETFIRSLHEDDEMFTSVLSMLASPLYGGNINDNFYVWTGVACNGKGTLDTIFQSVFGNYYCSFDTNQLTSYQKDADRPNSALAKARYARVLMCAEPESSEKDDTLKVSVIKKLTGTDPITTRYLNKNSFTYIPKFTLFMQTNDIPSLSKKDGGVERRMKIMPFPFVFNGKEGECLQENQRIGDPKIKEKIKRPEYRDGLLYLLLETFDKHQGKFYQPKKVLEATQEYMEEQNPVKHWFIKYYDVDVDEKNSVSATELFDYFEKENEVSVRLTQNQFGRFMKELCKWKKSGSIKYFCKRKVMNPH